MFDYLNSIDWENIKHSHGSARNFPDWFRDLQSEDSQKRTQAYRNLRQYSIHQGSIYQVTSYTVPPLIYLLQTEGLQDKAAIMDLLAVMVNCCDFVNDTPDQLTEKRKSWASYLPFSFEEQVARHQNTYNNARQGISTYLALLESEIPDLRSYSFGILTDFWEDLAQYETTLISKLDCEPEDNIKAQMIYDWSEMINKNSLLSGAEKLKRLEVVIKQLPSQTHFKTSFAAAEVLATAMQEALTEDAVKVFVDAVVSPYKYSLYPSDSVMLETTVHDACLGLGVLPAHKIIPLLLQLLPQISDPEDAQLVAIVTFGK